MEFKWGMFFDASIQKRKARLEKSFSASGKGLQRSVRVGVSSAITTVVNLFLANSPSVNGTERDKDLFFFFFAAAAERRFYCPGGGFRITRNP